MKEDIIVAEVTDVIVAIVPREGGLEEELWDTYLINLQDYPMENVLITSQGYGEIDGRDKTTTVLRHFHQMIAAQAYLKVEPIQTELFEIQNEYWISFNNGEQMLDKRFVFAAGQINPEAMELVPLLGRKGVMIK